MRYLCKRSPAHCRTHFCSPFSATSVVWLGCDACAQLGCPFDRMVPPTSLACHQVYSNVTNIVVRVSPKSLPKENMEHALMVSSHYDCTLGTPGAADDAVAIAVMLEGVRSLVNSPADAQHPIIFNFNGAEVRLVSSPVQHSTTLGVPIHASVVFTCSPWLFSRLAVDSCPPWFLVPPATTTVAACRVSLQLTTQHNNATGNVPPGFPWVHHAASMGTNRRCLHQSGRGWVRWP